MGKRFRPTKSVGTPNHGMSRDAAGVGWPISKLASSHTSSAFLCPLVPLSPQVRSSAGAAACRVGFSQHGDLGIAVLLWGLSSRRTRRKLPILKGSPRESIRLRPVWSEVKVAQSCLTLCDPMDCPWNSPGQNTGVGSLSLLQGIFLEIEPRSPILQVDSLPAEPPGKPCVIYGKSRPRPVWIQGEPIFRGKSIRHFMFISNLPQRGLASVSLW